MSKKKIGKHLRFYLACIKNGHEMPKAGLCACAWFDFINEEILMMFKPAKAGMFSYLASLKKGQDYYEFTGLRQTIVLFMAAINGEL